MSSPQKNTGGSGFKSRVGTAFRRASSFGPIIRPGSPSRKSSAASLRHEVTTPSPLAISVVSAPSGPSPIAESPARPLAERLFDSAPPPTEETPPPRTQSPTPLDTGVAAAVDLPEPSMDAPIETPVVTEAPVLPPTVPTTPEIAPVEIPAQEEPVPEAAAEPAPEAVAEPIVEPVVEPVVEEPVPEPVVEESIPEPEPEPTPEEPTVSEPNNKAPLPPLAKEDSFVVVADEPAAPPTRPEEPPVVPTPPRLLQDNVSLDRMYGSSEPTPRQGERPLEYFDLASPASQKSQATVIPPPQQRETAAVNMPMPVPAPSAIPPGVWEAARDRSATVSDVSTEDYGNVLHARDPMHNPFADSTARVSRSSAAPSWDPEPWVPSAMPNESRESPDVQPVPMPLPNTSTTRIPAYRDTLNPPYSLPGDGGFNNVSANPSYAYSFGTVPNPGDDGERRPLLPRASTPDMRDKGKAKSRKSDFPSFSSDNAIPMTLLFQPFHTRDRDVYSGGPYHQVPSTTLDTLGWAAHVLPDTTYYYAHAALRVVTDVDLRHSKRLDQVTHFLDRKLAADVGAQQIPAGWELWLRNGGRGKDDFVPVRHWVNHKTRTVSFEPPPTRSAEASLPDDVVDDDRLDMEYGYWTYLENHPAHMPVSDEVVIEAMDALTWSYTDNVLPMPRDESSPFSHAECQELMRVLQTLDSRDSDGTRFNAIVRTRVVAKILMRVAQWRQETFRPAKPLPKQLSTKAERRTPFLRAIFSFVISCLCLGIPYLFFERRLRGRFDEEGGLLSNGSIFALVGSGCIVAAIVLSASVTLLSLPGIDQIARLAGTIAVLLSSSSMVSSVLALFRHKADVERVVAQPRGEGVMSISKRSVILSLPLVFVAWAMAALVTGVTFYMFRGTTTPPSTGHPLEPFAQWSVIGVIGGLAVFFLLVSFVASR